MVYSSIAALLAAVLSYFFFDKEIVAFFCEHKLHFFRYITYLGDSAPYIFGSLIIYFLYRKRQKIAQKALFVFSSVFASGLVAVMLKVLIGRPRPKVYLHDHIYTPQLLEFHSKFWSMPSGHTTTAFAVAASFSFIWPRYKVLFFLAAILVALSRVALCKHYLSDVIVGAVLGTIVTYLLHKRYFNAI